MREQLEEFEKIFLNETESTSWCDLKMKCPNLSEQDQQQWKFIKLLFLKESEQLSLLGCKKEDVLKKVEAYTGQKYTKDEESSTNDIKDKKPKKKVFNKMSLEFAENFFD